MLTRRALSLAVLAWPASTLAAPTLRSSLKRIHRDAKNHGERLERVSRLFLGKPYHLNPLGEGPDGDRDTDPIADFSRFDCVTLVEEVMALAWHADLDDAIERLQRIRYTAGVIDYGQRKHITMAQWIPQNIAAGMVTDITRAVAGAHTRIAELSLTHADFESKKGKALKLYPDERPLGTHRLPIIRPGALLKLKKSIPAGTLITTIRESRENVPYRASHVSLLLTPDVVRHAHASSKRVTQDTLGGLLRRSKARKAWKLTGFNLLRISP